LRGTDWYATNYDDKTRAGLDRKSANYDFNVYGDEVATNIRNVSDGLLAAKNYSVHMYLEVFYNSTVSRTGYNETDLTDNKSK
jgi:hypothetical protein